MDEAIGDVAGRAVPCEEAVPVRQGFLEGEQLPAQVIGRVAVVVQMDLDLAIAGAAQLGQAFEVFRLVLFDGKEEGVARRPAIAIAETAELPRKLAHPFVDAPQAMGIVGTVRFRLEVVGEAQQQVDVVIRPRQPALANLAQVGRQPALEMAAANLPRAEAATRISAAATRKSQIIRT